MQDNAVDKMKDYYDGTREKEWKRLVKDSYHKIERG